MNANNEYKILVVGPAWVGDMVMAQTLFKLIKSQNAAAIIDVIAPDWTRALLERMPEVRRALSLPIKHKELKLRERYRIGKSLRSESYQQAILLPNTFKSALIPFWANIPKRTGWRGEMRYGLLNDMRYLDKQKLPLMIQRFAALGLEAQAALPADLPWPQLITSVERTQTALQKYGLTAPEKPMLALCPGAEFGPSKRWPARYYAEIAQAKIKQGWQVWLFGSLNDQDMAAEIQRLTNDACTNLIGKTNLADAIDLLTLSQLVVSNDSGLMHIAAALQKPLVVMYGSTSASFTPPLSKQVEILSLNLPCSPCFQRECPLGHFKCMLDLRPELVLAAIERVQ